MVSRRIACFLALLAVACPAAALGDEPMPLRPDLGEQAVTLSNPGLFEAQVSTYLGAVRSFRLLAPQFAQKEREPPKAPVVPPKEKLAAGPLDLVTTWDPAYFPYAVHFKDLRGASQVTRVLKSDPGRKVVTGDFWAVFEQDPVFTVVQQSATAVTMVWPDPADDQSTLYVERTYTVSGDYRLDASVRIVNLGAAEVTGRLQLQVVGWEAPVAPAGMCGSMFSAPADNHQVVCGIGTGVEKKDRAGVSAETWSPPGGRATFAGLNSRYFLLVALPTGDTPALCSGNGNAVGAMSASLVWTDPDRDQFILRAAPDSCIPAWAQAKGPLEGRRACQQGERMKGARDFTFTAFLGPKDLDALKAMGSNLEDTIDFWIVGFLAKPMLWLMRATYSVIPSWVVAILFLTLVVKALTLYWTQKSMIQMRRMQQLKPKIDELKNRYKDDKTKLNQATMDLYKREKVNPLGGCLPMLLQMPVWIALYRAIYGAVDLYQAPLIPGWIDDLSAHDPIFVMPLLLGGLMFLQQKMSPQTGDQAQAKVMMWMMPIMFTGFMLWLPSGLVFYILVNTLLSIGHQWYVNRKMPALPAKG